MNIKGKTAIVTGGASGFGLEISRMLYAEGAKLAVFDICEEKFASLKQEFPELITIVCDVSDCIQVENKVKELAAQTGEINILVNNAGIMKSAPLINMLKREDRGHSLEMWKKVIDVNLNSVFYMSRSVADTMLEKRSEGVIVNISSISARGNAGQSAYSASKAAVEALTKVWAKELGRFGIRCAAVAPGFSDTSGTHDALEQKTLNNWINQVPLRRLGTAQEIADSVMYIIKNDFVNGEILSVNGGLVL